MIVSFNIIIERTFDNSDYSKVIAIFSSEPIVPNTCSPSVLDFIRKMIKKYFVQVCLVQIQKTISSFLHDDLEFISAPREDFARYFYIWIVNYRYIILSMLLLLFPSNLTGHNLHDLLSI